MDEQVMVFINGKKYETVDKKEIFGYSVGICMDQLQYMSKEAMVSWIYECCSMIEELNVKSANLKRKVTTTRSYLSKNTDKMDREKTMSYVINLVLGSQDLGELHGFGISNKGAY